MLIPKNLISMEIVEHFSRIAAEAFMDDPVYKYAIPNEKKRKDYLYHFNLARLKASIKHDYLIYSDDNKYGICIFRDSRSSFPVTDFIYWPLIKNASYTLKIVNFNDRLNPEYFPENTYIVSPVYVDKNHWGKGIAKKLVREGVEDLKAKGFNIGLETQNPDIVKIYEKMGFETIRYEYFKEEDIHSWWMIYKD